MKVPTLPSLLLSLGAISSSAQAVTVYSQAPLAATTTGTAAAGSYTGAAAYNPTTLNPPPPPGPQALTTQFSIQLQNAVPPGASIQQGGSFFGFSIEMSVVNQVLGKNASVLQVPFLNLMANLQQRSGAIDIRVGGNTQETAVLVPSTPDGRILEKDLSGVSNPTQTPPLIFTPELLYMLANISSLVNVRWHLGIPFNDTSNFRLGIAEQGQQILGDRLIGLQVGNEPDLYAAHGHRPATYGPYDYLGEFSLLVNAMASDPNIQNQNLLIGPNIATGAWIPEMVWDTGFVDAFSTELAFLAVEHYPTDNCFAQFGIGTPQDPQQTFPNYLNHTSGVLIVAPYLNSTNFAQTKGKKLLMFETNTASCGGFVGISDSFGAALWGLDYAMQMAYSNFSGALFHVGGQSVFYNPFTPPPTNQSTFRAWTIGPIYYSSLVMAEVLGSSNTTQILDLLPNNANIFTPAYAIYDGGNLARVLLFNYVSDASGASDLSVQLNLNGVGGSGGVTQVQVKYLQASSVAQKGNFSWAGQTLGDTFSSDGRLQGTESIQTVSCSPPGTCTIVVPAPCAALVFLSSSALTENSGAASRTFATTVLTKTAGTATVDPALLATSNGHTGMDAKSELGSTSKGSFSGALGMKQHLSFQGVVVGVMLGLVGWGLCLW
ncbi:hypothetical protein BYT27DRAFT_7127069 [Phlegmacium glaucopus]|nr:hypothetical protein BYT27DRAFT_7127069 [Phlegmacium glaucopus]